MESSNYIIMLKNYVNKNGTFDGKGFNIQLEHSIKTQINKVKYEILYILSDKDNEICVFFQNPKDEDDCFALSIFELSNSILRKIVKELGIW